MKQIRVDLTADQISELKPLYKQADEAFAKGKPGIIIAQCTSSFRLVAAFIPYEPAKRIQQITHKKQ